MKTYEDLENLIVTYESKECFATGSQTILLEHFLEAYGDMPVDHNEIDKKHWVDSSDGTYKIWQEAYEKMTELEKRGDDYNICDLFNNTDTESQLGDLT